jgi:hypothetical protein
VSWKPQCMSREPHTLNPFSQIILLKWVLISLTVSFRRQTQCRGWHCSWREHEFERQSWFGRVCIFSSYSRVSQEEFLLRQLLSLSIYLGGNSSKSALREVLANFPLTNRSLQYVLESVPIVDRAFVHQDYASWNLPTHMRQQSSE